MKARDLRQMTREELEQELANQRKELYHLRHQRVVGELENPAQMRKCRKAIAQILTILRERELQITRGTQPVTQSTEAKQ